MFCVTEERARGGQAAKMDEKPSFTCRMYEEKYPEVDEVVMVQVKSIAEMGAYVSLLEYNNIDGMILLSELSRRRIRSVNKLIKVRSLVPPFATAARRVLGGKRKD